MRPRIHRVQLGKGKNSGERLRHIVPRRNAGGARVHRIIVGSTRNHFKPKENFKIFAGGTGGKKGTAELVFSRDGKRAELFSEVPLQHRKGGIGTDILKAAETLAKELGAEEIFGRITNNPAAVRTCEKAGWMFVRFESPGRHYGFSGAVPEVFSIYSKKLK